MHFPDRWMPRGRHWPALTLSLTLGATLLASCGGGNAPDGSSTATSTTTTAKALGAGPGGGVDDTADRAAAVLKGQRNAVRLAEQATFGPTEALIADIKSKGSSAWVQAQMALPASSRYTGGKSGIVHQNTSQTFFCDLPQYTGDYCWRDYFSTEPLLWNFYQNALNPLKSPWLTLALALTSIAAMRWLGVSSTRATSCPAAVRKCQAVAGMSAHRSSRRILGEIDGMEALLGAAKATPKGRLRVNVTLGFGRSHIAPLISRFVRKHPQVEVQLQLSVNPPPLTDDR